MLHGFSYRLPELSDYLKQLELIKRETSAIIRYHLTDHSKIYVFNVFTGRHMKVEAVERSAVEKQTALTEVSKK